jgi:hypothetical protein
MGFSASFCSWTNNTVVCYMTWRWLRMSITKTTSGEILYDGFTSGWVLTTYGTAGGVGADTWDGTPTQIQGPPSGPPSGVSGSMLITNAYTTTGIGEGYAYYTKTLNVGSGAGRRIHVWGGAIYTGGSLPTYWYYPIQTPGGVIVTGYGGAPWFWLGSTLSADEGNVVITASYAYLNAEEASEPGNINGATCGLIISTSDILTLTGFENGQMVQMYVSGSLVATEYASGGKVEFDLQTICDTYGGGDTIGYPFSATFQIYAPDGVTLLDSTSAETVCGGDAWQWIPPPVAGLYVASNEFIIYQGSSGSPNSATITGTLLKVGGAGYSGKTLTFATTLGSLSASSGTTNSSGQATTTLTSTASGIAVVSVSWAGDSNVPATTVYVMVHVFAAPEAPNSALPFQFFCEGVQYVISDGSYSLGTDEVVQPFEVDVPAAAYVSSITPMGLVGIYRWGVLEFRGVLTRIESTLSDAPTVKLKGVDASWLLGTRVVDLAYYQATTEYTLSNLLSNFPCGITAGSIGTSGVTVAELYDTITLLAAIKQDIQGATGWGYRVNANLTLDYSDSFGVDSSAVFEEATAPSGAKVIASSTTLTEDMSLVQNSVHARSSGSNTRSVAQDTTSIAAVGLVEGADLQPSISDVTTLAAIAQTDVAKGSVAGAMIQLTVIDGYASGTYHPYDSVTVTSPTLGLSGYYVVKQITRDLKNPYYAQLQLGARVPEAWQLDEPVKRIMTQLASG